MSLPRGALTLCFVLLWSAVCAGDLMVQLNVNRPFNDVNEKFVSFAIRPEDLYKALDGPHRKSMTRMAAMLGDSYVKFIGDYFFVTQSELKLRNPTKIIWRGFNRWTRAVNWTMVIPVPYMPGTWDPMVTLKILNSSHLMGVTDCIWQLGTDFGSSNAEDYVTDLSTLKLMVDSFGPYVEDWKVMGADISSGSSPDETRRYIESSKDLNAAFGWTQSTEVAPSNSIGSYIQDNDVALKTLLHKKVPVWLHLPQNTKRTKTKLLAERMSVDDVTDGLRWAQTLGDAASTGFDAVFKKISVADLERPTFSFYVTAVFKKVMGSRVFPARPLALFARHNKLYTHCANSISGGIAFMVVNNEESTMQISVRSATTLASSEIWQYTLTSKKQQVMLNNEKLTLNSTMAPLIKNKSANKPVQLTAPAMSVSFWVLPTVNLEHCQYTEVEAEEVEPKDSGEQKIVNKRYTSSDKLLKKLIQESALAHRPLAKVINRRRRYATFSERPKRFLLEDTTEKIEKKAKTLGKLFEPMEPEEKEFTTNSENEVQDRHRTALQWLREFVEQNMNSEGGLLKRETRSIDDDYFGSFFPTKNDKQTGITKKITEIRKPEKKTKPIFDPEEFDEEEFFKKINEHTEPEYRPLPQGDIFLKHITNAEGEEIEEFKEETKKPSKNKKKKTRKSEDISKETKSEMKPLRLLPTEFYEALPANSFNPANKKLHIGSALNSLLFAEPFSKKLGKTVNKIAGKVEDVKTAEVEEIDTGRSAKQAELAQDFVKAQRELRKMFLKMSEHEGKRDNDADPIIDEENPLETNKDKRKYLSYLEENIENFFGDKAEKPLIKAKSAEIKQSGESLKKGWDELPWWDLSSLRKKRSTRALKLNVPENVWETNMINKDDELTPLGAMLPEQLAMYEYQMVSPKHKKYKAYKASKDYMQDNETENEHEGLFEQEQESAQENHNNKGNDTENVGEKNEQKPTNGFMSQVKQKVTRFMDILARHVNDWYNTLQKHVKVETTTAGNVVN